MIRQCLRAVILMTLAPAGLWAQAGGTAAGSSEGPAPSGNGDAAPLQNTGDSIRRNVLLLSMASETAYDDNVFSTSQPRRGDLSFHLSPRMVLREERKHLTLALDYQPDLLLYRETRGFNAFSHGLQLDARLRFTSRFNLRLTDSFSYRVGIFQPRPSEEVAPQLGPSASLNPTVFTPLGRQRENNMRLDMVYQKSARTSLDWFAGFQDLHFGRVATASSLQDTQGVKAGLEYLYRLDRHNTLGALYLFQKLTSQQGQRAIVHTALLSFARQLSPNVTLSVFGGPEYTSLQDNLILDPLFFRTAFPIARTRTHWALGGAFTKRSKDTESQISADRRASEGGGLLGPVISSSINLNVRRRLVGHWNATWSFIYADNSALGAAQSRSHVRSGAASVSLGRQLTKNLTTQLGYTYIVQHSADPTLLFARFNRNRVSFGVFYRYHEVPLGR